MTRPRSTSGFSLVELVIVIVIIGVLAAIAIPRFSRASEGASLSAVKGDLAVLRNSLEMYSAEHANNYPEFATFTAQMTTYSNAAGTTAAAYNATTAPYGPYLRSVPVMKYGGANSAVLQEQTGVPSAEADATGGWLYDDTTGSIWANDDDVILY